MEPPKEGLTLTEIRRQLRQAEDKAMSFEIEVKKNSALLEKLIETQKNQKLFSPTVTNNNLNPETFANLVLPALKAGMDTKKNEEINNQYLLRLDTTLNKIPKSIPITGEFYGMTSPRTFFGYLLFLVMLVSACYFFCDWYRTSQDEKHRKYNEVLIEELKVFRAKHPKEVKKYTNKDGYYIDLDSK